MLGDARESQLLSPGILPLDEIDNRWVNIAFARDRWRISKLGSNTVEQVANRHPLLCLDKAIERHRAGMPRTEVLGRKLLAHDLVKVVVHIGRADRARFALLILVLEQVLAGQVLHPPNHSRERMVAKFDLALLSALAFVAQAQGIAFQLGMDLRERRAAEAEPSSSLVVAPPDAA